MPSKLTRRCLVALIVLLTVLFACLRVVEEYEAQILNITDKAKYVTIHWVEMDKLVFNGMVEAHSMSTLYIEPGCYRCVAMDLRSGRYNASEVCWTKEEFDEALKEGKIPQFVFYSIKAKPNSTKLVI